MAAQNLKQGAYRQVVAATKIEQGGWILVSELSDAKIALASLRIVLAGIRSGLSGERCSNAEMTSSVCAPAVPPVTTSTAAEETSLPTEMTQWAGSLPRGKTWLWRGKRCGDLRASTETYKHAGLRRMSPTTTSMRRFFA